MADTSSDLPASSKGEPDYSRFRVRKPWGHEYLMYENGTVGVWFLHIKEGARTSMHCHPQKKTGLIVLSGEATLSFLNDSTRLKPLGKMMIREGLFHSTMAALGDVTMIEVETPCNKRNLVRMDDAYGREEKPYEGRDALEPLTLDCVRLAPAKDGGKASWTVSGCSLTMEDVLSSDGLKARSGREVILVLAGGLYSREGDPVLGPGDVVSADTLHRLAERFQSPRGASILSLRKDS